jgi:hypothetical protein
LSEYLDNKRSEFARLYFTSNEELIGLMGNLSNQTHLQVFLSKLFEGISGLVFDNTEGGNTGDIIAFHSVSKEKITL